MAREDIRNVIESDAKLKNVRDVDFGKNLSPVSQDMLRANPIQIFIPSRSV